MKREALSAMIQGCRKGNRLNQKELYKHFFYYGMNVCSRYACSDAEAEEMMNDAFLRIFTKMDLYDDKLSFPAWLHTIMVRSAINYLKKYHPMPTTEIVDSVTQHIVLDETVLYLPLVLFAQNGNDKITISGYMKNAQTGESLIGASIFMTNEKSGTVTNDYGFYSVTIFLRLKLKKFDMRVQTRLNRFIEKCVKVQNHISPKQVYPRQIDKALKEYKLYYKIFSWSISIFV
jgi:RNA polymerase sigma factor (sigma-70 family)